MNKKLNTVLFVLGATVFNIIAAIASFIVLFLLYANFLAAHIPETARSWSFSLIFMASLVSSFFIYRAVLKYLLTKVNVEKYFDPLFIRKNIKKE